MNKRIEICIGTDRAKHLRARLSLLLEDEAGRLVLEHYHSIPIHPGADLAEIRRVVETHLANPESGIPGAPWPAIPEAEWADVAAHCTIVHKPAVVAAYQAKLEAARELEAAAAAAAK